MNAVTNQPPRLVSDMAGWIDQASIEELRAAYSNERALSALMAKRYVDALDQNRELRTVLRQVIDHSHSRGHPMYGEVLEVLNRTGLNAHRG